MARNSHDRPLWLESVIRLFLRSHIRMFWAIGAFCCDLDSVRAGTIQHMAEPDFYHCRGDRHKSLLGELCSCSHGNYEQPFLFADSTMRHGPTAHHFSAEATDLFLSRIRTIHNYCTVSFFSPNASMDRKTSTAPI